MPNKHPLHLACLVLLMGAVGLAGCTSTPAPTGASSTSPDTALAAGDHYFARQAPAATGEGASNFEFVRFSLEADGNLSGVQISQRYGTDGLAGSFRGVYDPQEDVVRSQIDYLAEGERYRESRDFGMAAEGLRMGYDDARGQPVVLPRVDAEGYQARFDAFQQQMLDGATNTTDRTRLLRIEALRRDLPEERLREVRFYERYVDLDHDPGSAEYLLYVMDPVFCGTGGCNLFVVDDAGRVLSETTVVKLPVYTTRTSIDEQQARQGTWRDLFVWSQGMRRLRAADGRYPRNASMQPRVLEQQLLDLPEHYRLLMDHPD